MKLGKCTAVYFVLFGPTVNLKWLPCSYWTKSESENFYLEFGTWYGVLLVILVQKHPVSVVDAVLHYCERNGERQNIQYQLQCSLTLLWEKRRGIRHPVSVAVQSYNTLRETERDKTSSISCSAVLQHCERNGERQNIQYQLQCSLTTLWEKRREIEHPVLVAVQSYNCERNGER